MKRFTGKVLLLAGLFLAFSQVSLATDGGRTELSGPGEAEVIAGTGYEHTLFDSAEKKCQNCHNDLYDTWKKSMHAKSWVDPIFQVKYQDFLRLQASKIGAVGPTGEYKEGTIQKTGQVCIKCHAPTAYYSGDYKITLTEVGDQNTDPNAYAEAKASLEENLAGSSPPYNPANEATVVSMARTGKVYTVSYHIGNSHNREGINCAFCHSVETVRMMNDVDGDIGQYTLKGPIKMGPIGPVVRNAGETLFYSPDASDLDMNAFFALIGPEKYSDFSNTPKASHDYDLGKAADGRYTMKSIDTGCVTEKDGECTSGYYTGGPFYGPFGVTGLGNSRDDDLSDRAAQVKYDFQVAVDDAYGDKFESKHHFAAYGKALCLSCHQRSSLMLNPESADGGITVDPVTKEVTSDHQFLELCSTWTAMSDGVGNNFEDTPTSPKCQRCHMEPLEKVTDKDGNVKDAVVLHQWDQPDTLFTLADADLTHHFLPPSDGGTEGPVAEGYLNNHAFMGANKGDFGLVKIKTGFESGVNVKRPGKGNGKKGKNENKLAVNTYLLNKTAHMFPGAHPMRRVLTRVIVTDKDGNKLPFKEAKGKSRYENITNQLAVLPGNTIKDGFEEVEVEYNDDREIVIQGYKPDLAADEEYVNSQFMDQTLFDWVSPDGTVTGSSPVQTASGAWVIKGKTTAKLITDIEGGANHFTRIYGRETGMRAPDGSHVVRPGFDSNIATDNRLKPNEMEEYAIEYDTRGAAYPLTVKYKVYYLKKGGSGKFPECKDKTSQACEYGFLDTSLPASTLKKLAIWEVFDYEEEVTLD
jgi:hypothetical protein